MTQVPSSPSLDALKAEATVEDGPIWTAIAGWFANFRDTTDAGVDDEIRSLCDRAYALGLSERVQTETAEDVRERAFRAIRIHGVAEEWADKYVESLASAGLLASPPQTVKVPQKSLVAMSIAIMQSAASDDLQPIVDRWIGPNLVIEE